MLVTPNVEQTGLQRRMRGCKGGTSRYIPVRDLALIQGRRRRLSVAILKIT